MRIKEIELVFENCEVITIPGKYIGTFRISNIRKSITRIAINSVRMMETAKNIAIEINKNADSPHRPFGTKGYGTNFDRILQYNDITSIEVVLEDVYDISDGKKEIRHVLYTDWIGDSEYENEGQKSIRSDLGHLYIVISKRNKKKGYFNKVFPPTEINNKEYIDSYFNLLDDGNTGYEDIDVNG